MRKLIKYCRTIATKSHYFSFRSRATQSVWHFIYNKLFNEGWWCVFPTNLCWSSGCLMVHDMPMSWQEICFIHNNTRLLCFLVYNCVCTLVVIRIRRQKKSGQQIVKAKKEETNNNNNNSNIKHTGAKMVVNYYFTDEYLSSWMYV